ncbi:hypothetical protein [Roseiconus lacunae]|uniref:hypothetical protein n=1 Tax=Roseiconus lacunae TaxID=2605694 RepID=UPI0011F19F49|nr:hypothetical protein [Roseiconus lacunae]
MFRVRSSTRDNTASVMRSVEKFKHDILAQFAQDLESEAKAILTESDFASSPGQPPNIHSSEPNLETFDSIIEGDTVKAGPVGFPGSSITPALPGLLERGGVATVRRRSRQTGRVITQTRHIAARPYMGPAAERAIRKLHAHARRGIKR